MSVVVELNPAHSQARFEGYKLWQGSDLPSRTVAYRGHSSVLCNGAAMAETSRAATEAYGRHNHLQGVHWAAGDQTQLLWWDSAGRLWCWTANSLEAMEPWVAFEADAHHWTHAPGKPASLAADGNQGLVLISYGPGIVALLARTESGRLERLAQTAIGTIAGFPSPVSAFFVRAVAGRADGTAAVGVVTFVANFGGVTRACLARFLVAKQADGSWGFSEATVIGLESWPRMVTLMGPEPWIVHDATPANAVDSRALVAAATDDDSSAPSALPPIDDDADVAATQPHEDRNLVARHPLSLDPMLTLILGSYLCDSSTLTLANNEPIFLAHICDDVDGAAIAVAGVSEAQAPPALVAQHVYSFPALTYVLASKERRKFVAVAHNGGLAVVAETEPQLLLYAAGGKMAVWQAPSIDDRVLGLQLVQLRGGDEADLLIALLCEHQGLVVMNVPRELFIKE